MAWLGEGFSTLKGQITNFTKEVLSDGKEHDNEFDVPTLQGQVKELKACCESQYLEIAELRQRNEQLKLSRDHEEEETAELRQRNEQLRVALELAKAQLQSDDVPEKHNGQQSVWSYTDLEGQLHHPRAEFKVDSGIGHEKNDNQYLVQQINQLETENKVIKDMCQELELQVFELSEQLGNISKEDLPRTCNSHSNNLDGFTINTDHFGSEEGVPSQSQNKESYSDLILSRDELVKSNQCLKTELEAVESTVQDLESKLTELMDENATLTSNLEELDQQNQLVIDQLLLAKNNVIKENEVLSLELQKAKHVDCNDVSTNTTEEDVYSTLKVQCEEEMLQHLQKMITFDLPKTLGIENTNSSKYECLLTSVVKACEEFSWKTKTIEKKFASLINEQRELKEDLEKRDERIAELYKQVATLEEREVFLMKELNNNSEQLEVIPESQEEVERLEQHISHLENELRETALLKEEIARLKEERNIAETRHRNKDSDGELEQDNDKLKEEVHKLLNKIEFLEKEFGKSSEEYTVLKDLYGKNKDAYDEVVNIKTQLENELLLKQTCLQKALNHNEELTEKNNSLLANFKSQEETLKTNSHITLEYSKLQKLVLAKEEELQHTKETNADLQLRLSNIEAAKAALEAENLTFISQLKCEEEVQAQKDSQLSMLEIKVSSKQSEFDEIIKEYNLKQQEFETLVIRNLSLESEIKELKKCCEDQQNTIASLNQNISELMTKSHDMKYILEDALKARDELTKKCDESVGIGEQIVNDNKLLQSKVDHLTSALSDLEMKLKAEVESNGNLTEMCASLNDKLESLKQQEQELSLLRETCIEKDSVLQELTKAYHIKDSEYQKLKQELSKQVELKLEVQDLKNLLENLQKRYDDVCEAKKNLKDQFESALMQLPVVGTEDETTEESMKTLPVNINLSEQISKLLSERVELIKAVRVKHTENLAYHNEIQRLNGLLSQEIAKSQNNYALYESEQKSRAAIEAELMEVKTHLENVQQTTGPVQLQSQEHKQNGENVVTTTSDPCIENVQLSPRHEPGVVEALKEEHTKLLEAMQQENTRNIYLQNEVQELTEKENSLLKELERLRYHLVEVEDGYTQEVVVREKEISDLQNKLASAEERIKGFNTALTSASVRANQHVETLQDQTRLIGQQRDDIQMKLCAAEDQIQKQTAALINLQAVLEQFQRDKDQEMAALKVHHQTELEKAEAHQTRTSTEVHNLQRQLLEAKEGLSAAARLNQQLDNKSQLISDLKEEVNRLQSLLLTAEKREESASLHAEAKVDRYLLKNLLVGYLTAPNNTKPQALKILSTVLDFTHEERARAGLEAGSGSSNSWLHKLLHPGPGTDNNQSLSEAFIRFLESESRPQPQLQLLPAVQEEQRRQSTQSISPGSSGRSSISLAEVQLPTFTQFPAVRSSSSILKDVLKDNQ